MCPCERVQIRHELDQLPSARLELARRRQAALWRGERPDQWPICSTAPLTSSQQAMLPECTLGEAFYDSELMLTQQLRGFFSVANSGSDAVPSIRANTGTGTLMSMLGHDQLVFPDKMPWFKDHYSKAQLAKLTPDDFQVRGDFAVALEHMRVFKQALGTTVPIFCPDTQGPFDLAHLLLGDALFMEVFDDPPFVHHLMQLSLELGTLAYNLAKEVSGEPRDQHWHGNSLYAENMGIRICEDTTAIMGPDIMAEFALPYTQQLAQRFGGAWVHYCGRNDHLTKGILAMPEIRGLNFGHIPGHEHDHLFEVDMERCLEAGKIYFGSWPIRPGESGPEYLRRLHGWAAQGCLLPKIGVVPGFADVQAALHFWYSL